MKITILRIFLTLLLLSSAVHCLENCAYQLAQDCASITNCYNNLGDVFQHARLCNGSIEISIHSNSDSVYTFTENYNLTSNYSSFNFSLIGLRNESRSTPTISISQGSLTLFGFQTVQFTNISFMLDDIYILTPTFTINNNDILSSASEFRLENIKINGSPNSSIMGTLFSISNMNVSLTNVSSSQIQTHFLTGDEGLFSLIQAQRNREDDVQTTFKFAAEKISFIDLNYTLISYEDLEARLIQQMTGAQTEDFYSPNSTSILSIEGYEQIQISGLIMNSINNLTGNGIKTTNRMVYAHIILKELQLRNCYLNSFTWINTKYRRYIEAMGFTVTDNKWNGSALFGIQDESIKFVDSLLQNNEFWNSSVFFPIQKSQFQQSDYPKPMEIRNLTFDGNTFTSFSFLLTMSYCDLEVTFEDNSFNNNTFLKESQIFNFVGVSSIYINKNSLANTKSEKEMFQLLIADHIEISYNNFTDFIRNLQIEMVDLTSNTGGIFNLQTCRLLHFISNTIDSYYSFNQQAVAIYDDVCAKNSTPSMVISNNTFINSHMIADSDSSTLLRVEFDYTSAPIIFEGNTFYNNTLENTYSYIRSATALLFYATGSDVRVSNSSFINNKGTLTLNCAGFFVNNLIIEDTIFEDNGADKLDGIVYKGTLVSTSGGGLAFSVSTLRMNRTIFRHNFASEGGAIQIQNSNFQRNDDKNKNLVVIENTTFVANSATIGGAIHFTSANNHYKLQIVNCKFDNNYARLSGGAIAVSSNIFSEAEFEIKNSVFTRNLVKKGQGGCIFNEGQVNISLSDNVFNVEENVNAILLRHQNSTFSIKNCSFHSIPARLPRNFESFELITIDSSFAKLMSLVEFTNCSFIGIPFDKKKVHPTILYITGLKVNVIERGSFYNAISFYKGGIIQVHGGATYVLSKSKFVNISRKDDQNASFDLSNALTYSLLGYQTAILVTSGSFFIATDLTFENFYGSAMFIADSSVLRMNNSVFRNITGGQGGALNLLAYDGQSPSIRQSIIDNSSFYSCRGNQSGAIVVSEKRVNVTNCFFQENYAVDGAGILSLTKGNQEFFISNCTFLRNEAVSGGGISFKGTKPNYDYDTLRFIDNRAIKYAPNIASNSTNLKLKIKGTTVQNYTFSQQTSLGKLSVDPSESMDGLMFYLLDEWDQHVATDSTSMVTLSMKFTSGSSPPTSFQLTKERANEGIVSFKSDNLIVYGNPLTVSQINASLEGTPAKVLINLEIRGCRPGEIYNNETFNCFQCPAGTFSFTTKDTTCSPCPPNAACFGGDSVNVLPGYWRPSETSIDVLDCGPYAKNCLGGNNSACSPLTSGLICGFCNSSANPPLVREGHTTCAQCKHSLLTYILLYILWALVAGLVGIIYVYISLQSNIGFTKHGLGLEEAEANTKSKTLGIYARIFSTYLQFLMLLKKFGFDIVEVATNIVSYVVSPSNVSYSSISCLLALSGLSDNSTVILLIRHIINPLLIWVVSCFYIYCKKSTEHGLGKKIEYYAAFIIVFIWQQPIVTDTLLSYWPCKQILDKSYLIHYLSVECGSNEYVIVRIISVIGLVIWLGIFPLALFGRLFLNKYHLKEGRHRIGLGALYNGYKINYFYWGLVTFFLKNILVIFSNVWTAAGAVHGMILLAMCAVYCKVLLVLQPYSMKDHNSIEFLSFVVFSIVIFCIVSLEEATSKSLKIILIAIVVISNLYFLLMLLIGVFDSLREKLDPYMISVSKFFKGLGRRASISYRRRNRLTMDLDNDELGPSDSVYERDRAMGKGSFSSDIYLDEDSSSSSRESLEMSSSSFEATAEQTKIKRYRTDSEVRNRTKMRNNTEFI